MATRFIHHRWTYDVFVSFRGEDIRKSFMDHLFKDFKHKGIHAFRDDHDHQLPRGEEICSELFKVIEESRFLIVIFSKNYASSSWCLRELVKILECKRMGNDHKHHIQVIFYDVKPDVVRNQTGCYADAFEKHEFSSRSEVAKWKEALSMAANISGWDLQDKANGYESKFIDGISNEILEILCIGPVHVGENLVGVDARVNQMNLLRLVGSTDKVHMIGICGIGGIGKTTLAKAIYNHMYNHFEKCCFCEDVQGAAKRHGLTQVLTQLIDDIMKTKGGTVSNISQGIMILKQKIASKRILLVVDDVDHLDQLQALAGSPNWFFPGSLIIFTSKDKQLLTSYKMDITYEMEFLNDVEALELFSLHAFGEKHPTEDFKELVDQVVQYVKGHPLALKILGHFLCNKIVPEWKSELDRLQEYPNAEIQQVLRLSFNRLDIDQKRMFLDISSSFIGVNKDFAVSVLDSCNFFADTNMRVLADKSLIKISSTLSLQMHDLIQAMAREIIREESDRPGKRSRLWIPSEVCDVLNKNKVTEAVEILVLLLDKSSQKVNIDCKSFSRMDNLRILKIWMESENFELSKDSKVNYYGSLEFLSNELRLLYWHGYPFKFLPSDFYPQNIVAIDMSYSHIKNLWITPMCFNRLKVMKLRHCHNLTNTPDFTEITNLEELILEGCVNLVEVHPSVGLLSKLVTINMRNCMRLRSFPSIIEMHSLQILIFSGCLKFDKLPKVMGTLKSLVELRVDRTSIKEFPSFVLSQKNLRVLSIGGHGRIQSSVFWPFSLLRILQPPSASLVLPSLEGLHLLTHLDVSHCNISELQPESIGGLSCLQHLNLSGNNFTSLPASLSQLSQLTMLGLVGCKKLQVLPQLPPKVSQIDAIDCIALRELQKQQVLNDSYYLLFDFTNCPKLVENHTVESMMYLLLPQKRNYKGNSLHIVLHGSRIPLWFTNHNIGNHAKVELPPGWLYNKFRGYGTCVVFKAKNLYSSSFSHLTCKARNFDGNVFHRDGVHLGTIFPNDTIRPDGSDLIWFHYSRLTTGWKKVNNFITFTFTSSADIEVKECGVRLVYDEDIQEEIVSEIIADEPPYKKNRIV